MSQTSSPDERACQNVLVWKQCSHDWITANEIAWKVETSPKCAYQGPSKWIVRTAILGFNWTQLLANPQISCKNKCVLLKETCLRDGCLGMPASELWNAWIHGCSNACSVRWAGQCANNETVCTGDTWFTKTGEVWKMMHANRMRFLGVQCHIYETQKWRARTYT